MRIVCWVLGVGCCDKDGTCNPGCGEPKELRDGEGSRGKELQQRRKRGGVLTELISNIVGHIMVYLPLPNPETEVSYLIGSKVLYRVCI